MQESTEVTNQVTAGDQEVTTGNQSVTTGNQEDFDLAAELARATEDKTPGSSPGNQPVNNAGSFWGSDDDFEPVPEPKKPAAAPVEDKPAGERKVTRKDVSLSASTAVGMLDFTQRSLLTPIVNWKTKRKLTKQQWDRVEEIEDKDPESLPAEDKQLLSAFERLMKKRDKLVQSIPFQEDEKKDLQDCFEKYFEHTQKSMSPGMLVAFGIANTVGKRVIDIAFSE